MLRRLNSGPVKKKILINASNLHVGGGVQVASSLIYEISTMHSEWCEELEISVCVSTEVNENIGLQKIDIGVFKFFAVKNCRGINSIFQLNPFFLRKHDVVFTVFGPLYAAINPRVNIIGFALPNLIYGVPQQFDKPRLLRCFESFTWPLKRFIQLLFIKSAHVIVVELDHVKESLVKKGLAVFDSVYVVPNTLSGIYNQPLLWKDLDIVRPKVDLVLGYLGANYPHKNIEIFPEVHRILKEKYNISSKLIVTFSGEEWSKCSLKLKDCCVNIGRILVNECPAFYRNIDCVFFPSLRECFSALPLEAMFMKKPIFLARQRFNVDVCGEYGYYFNPDDPYNVAQVIAENCKSASDDDDRLNAARNHAKNFSNPKNRASRVLEIIMKSQ